MSYKVQYFRSDVTDGSSIERSFEQFVAARAFFEEKKKVSDIVIFSETRVIDIAFVPRS